MTTIPTVQALLLREAEVAALVGYSARTLRAWVSAGKFPRPIRQPDATGHSTKRWLRSEIEKWIAELADQREKSPA